MIPFKIYGGDQSPQLKNPLAGFTGLSDPMEKLGTNILAGQQFFNKTVRDPRMRQDIFTEYLSEKPDVNKIAGLMGNMEDYSLMKTLATQETDENKRVSNLRQIAANARANLSTSAQYLNTAYLRYQSDPSPKFKKELDRAQRVYNYYEKENDIAQRNFETASRGGAKMDEMNLRPDFDKEEEEKGSGDIDQPTQTQNSDTVVQTIKNDITNGVYDGDDGASKLLELINSKELSKAEREDITTYHNTRMKTKQTQKNKEDANRQSAINAQNNITKQLYSDMGYEVAKKDATEFAKLLNLLNNASTLEGKIQVLKQAKTSLQNVQGGTNITGAFLNFMKKSNVDKAAVDAAVSNAEQEINMFKNLLSNAYYTSSKNDVAKNTVSEQHELDMLNINNILNEPAKSESTFVPSAAPDSVPSNPKPPKKGKSSKGRKL